ncbi:MAG: PaaI family thioesterase [Dehalococcoidia bacterium]|nr:PaaI family thioesterase [Dehalococcoidia bacterium]
MGEGTTRLSGTCDGRFSNRGGGIHGGTYGAFAACAAEMAAATVLGDGLWPSFVEYRAQIFRPLVVGGLVVCDARVVHRGRRYLSVTVDVLNGEGRLCALFTSTLAVVPEPPPGLAPIAALEHRELRAPTYIYEQSPSFTTFGVRVVTQGDGLGIVDSAYDAAFAGHEGDLHPAFIAAVADSVAVPACMSIKAEDENFTTLEYKINFLRQVWSGTAIRAEGRVVERDHRAFVVDVAVTGEDGQLCAKMLTSLAVLTSTG